MEDDYEDDGYEQVELSDEESIAEGAEGADGDDDADGYTAGRGPRRSETEAPVDDAGGETSDAEGADGADSEHETDDVDKVALPEVVNPAQDANQDWEYLYVIPDDNRRTSHVLSKAEFVEALSIRTEQIANDGQSSALIEITPGMTTAREIAMEELRQRRCPLKLRRKVGTRLIGGKRRTVVEIWRINEMTMPSIQ